MTVASGRSRGIAAAISSSTTASSGSVRCTRSAPSTASPGVAATCAPAASSARALASVRFHTVTPSPRRSIPSTIALPSSPVPRNATVAIADLRVESTPVFTRAFFLGCLVSAVVTVQPTGLRTACCGLQIGIVSVAAQPRVLRWAGDPEGGAPFVEADPAQPDRHVGFDVEIAALLASGAGRTPEFVNVRFELISQSIARGDADIGLSGIEDTPALRATMAVTLPYYEFREVLSVRDADAGRFQSLADLRGKTVGYARRHDRVRDPAARRGASMACARSRTRMTCTRTAIW